ncbi:MAG: ATP-binding cassette domain-containing protein [Flavobacteriales bacterium]|nr:ATP-binding cassette domain-containing protein [Flavobacteriales bacterium]
MDFEGIRTEDLGKRFSREWILRAIRSEFRSGEKWAVLGPNGTGKSTFLKLLSGYVAPTQGEIIWTFDGRHIPLEKRYSYLSYSAPYLELPEEYSLDEILKFHFRLKQVRSEAALQEAIVESGLDRHRHKLIRDFSSGMKQRVKLILCLLSDVKVYLLDEPCTNLDEHGVSFYDSLLSGLSAESLCLIASNDPREFRQASKHILLNRPE